MQTVSCLSGQCIGIADILRSPESTAKIDARLKTSCLHGVFNNLSSSSSFRLVFIDIDVIIVLGFIKAR